MRVMDRFGDNGLVGVAILDPLRDGAREIDTLLLSCRVMGRGVEAALVSFLIAHTRASAAERLHGRFIPTLKNAPARECYADLGFSLVQECGDGEQVWSLELATGDVSTPAWLQVNPPHA